MRYIVHILLYTNIITYSTNIDIGMDIYSVYIDMDIPQRKAPNQQKDNVHHDNKQNQLKKDQNKKVVNNNAYVHHKQSYHITNNL